MIKARFYTEGECICMELSGHAGQAKKGQDLICASASMLAYTVAQAVRFLFEEDKLLDEPQIGLEDGNALVEAAPKQEFFDETLHTFFVAQVGFHLLAHNYPQAVELISFGKSL